VTPTLQGKKVLSEFYLLQNGRSEGFRMKCSIEIVCSRFHTIIDV
jgi:hypothetical protein